MTKQEFIDDLKHGLRGWISDPELQSIAENYDAAFEKGTASGKSEEMVAQELGSPAEIARAILDRRQAGNQPQGQCSDPGQRPPQGQYPSQGPYASQSGQYQGQYQNQFQGPNQGQYQTAPQSPNQGRYQTAPQGQFQGQYQNPPQGFNQSQGQTGAPVSGGAAYQGRYPSQGPYASQSGQYQGQYQNQFQGSNQGRYQTAPQGQFQGYYQNPPQGQFQGQYQSGAQFQGGAYGYQMPPVDPKYTPYLGRMASMGKRVIAYLIDQFILALIMVLVLFLFVCLPLFVWDSIAYISDWELQIFMLAAILILLLGYYLLTAVFLWATNGLTPGKWMLKIRVVKFNGQKITFMDAILREALVKGFASSMSSGLLNIGSLIWGCATDMHKTVHDQVADTTVVLDEKR